ncbi:MAG: hypothetical protein K0U41_03010 [Gammaproteobacteria bacterium]|nr:hypothetical protein [Gammaproteobacteria bacterium]
MRENTFTHISVPASAAAKNCQTTQTEMGMATRIEAHKQPTTQSVEPTSNQNIVLNESSITDSPISGGGNTHRPTSGLNSGKHLTGLTRLASLILATLLLAACGGGGGGGPSGGDPSAPATPRGLDWSVAGGAILLDWNGVSGASNYTISRNSSRTGGDSLAATIISNSNYTDIGVPLGNAYEYKISACNNLGCSANASLAVDYFAPTVPRNLNSVVNDGSIDLTWGASSWADNYKINRNALVLVAAPTTNAYTDLSVTDGVTYNYKVMACNRVTCSADSTLVSVFYSTSPPPAPSGLKLSIGATGIVLQWSTVAGASYKINLATTELAADIAGNSYTHAGADLSSSPVYNVVACNGFGCSQPATFTMDRFDLDDDDVFDAVDVDDDGDGLIELHTAAELNMMRNNLNGTGLDSDNSDMVFDTGGNSMGCGGGRPGDASVCNGYEQMADIDLNDLDTVYPGIANWEPTGRCTSGVTSEQCASSNIQYFSAKFNGNDHTINNLRIIVTEPSTGIGFFGGTLAGSELRNIHIRNGSITTNVGIQNLGGLVGEAVETTIISSSATMSRVSGTITTGGLVGYARGVTIVSSYALADELTTSQNDISGLVGASSGGTTNIISSVAIIGDVNAGTFRVGGLFGSASNVNINSSYVVVSSSMSILHLGGLVGRSFGDISIDASYVAVDNSIAGNGGLVGDGTAMATNSYWDTTTLTPSANISLPINSIGMGLPTAALQSGTSTSAGTNSIFSEWDNGYCNPTTGEFRDSTATDFVRAWDLGTDTEYPALNCLFDFTPAQQRETAARALAGETLVE